MSSPVQPPTKSPAGQQRGTRSPRTRGPRLHPITRYHRILGIASVTVVLVTIASGLALNHTDALKLAQRAVQSPAVNAWYGQPAPSIDQGFATTRGFVVQMGQRLFLDTIEIGRDPARLRGAATTADALFVLLEDKLLEFDTQLRKVDAYTELDGLAPPLTRLAADDRAVSVETAAGVRQLAPASGQWTGHAGAAPTWLTPLALPPELYQALVGVYAGAGISYERVLLDLHSGRVLGGFGVFLVDAAALCLLYLALSGVWMFFKFKRANGGARRPGAPLP